MNKAGIVSLKLGNKIRCNISTALHLFSILLILVALLTVIGVNMAHANCTLEDTLDGQAAGDFFGHSVSVAGDVNDDGYPDFMVGAPGNDSGAIWAGAAYVYCGQSGALLYTFFGDSAGDAFGSVVSWAGDVNSDGYDDVIVGAYFASGERGYAKVFSGQTGAVIHSIRGYFSGDWFGYAVSGLGDLDSDGHAEVLVGAPHYDTVYNNDGAAFVFDGLTGLQKPAVFAGEASGDMFGSAVSSAGDVNGDTVPDLIIGAPYNDSSGSDAGAAYVYSGSDWTPLYTFRGETSNDNFGWAVAGQVDINSDGYDDILVGAPQSDSGGSVYIYSGQNGALLYTLHGETLGDNFGFSLSGIRDVDDDGFDDFIVGAPYNDSGGPDAGRAYLYSGENGDILCILTGEEEGDEFGYAVAGLIALEWWFPRVFIGAPHRNYIAGTLYDHKFIIPCPPISIPSNPRPPDQTTSPTPRTADMYWNSCAPVLLNAHFDDKLLVTQLNAIPPVETDGANDGEPAFVSGTIDAFLQWNGENWEGSDLPAWLTVCDRGSGHGSIGFNFLNDREYSTGTIYIQADLLFIEQDDLILQVLNLFPGSVMLKFGADGTVGLQYYETLPYWENIGNYETCAMKETWDRWCITQLLMIFRLDDNPPTFDIWLDGYRLVRDRELPADLTDNAIQSIVFRIDMDADLNGLFRLEHLLVTRDPPGCPTEYDHHLHVEGYPWEPPLTIEEPLFFSSNWRPGKYYEWRITAYNPDWLTEGPVWDFKIEDDDVDEYEVGVEFVQYYKDRPCDDDPDHEPSDLKATEDDARNFYDEMHSGLGWTKAHARANGAACERFWGSQDDDPDDGIDQVDFAYFSGHGAVPTPGPVFSNPVDACVLTPNRCGEWGSTDLEWIAWCACQTLREDVAHQWCDCFDFLHLICGSHVNMFTQPFSDHYGKNFARRLYGHEDYGSKPYKVVPAWYWEINRSCRNRFKDWSPAYIGESNLQFNDYVWGAGRVTWDELHDSWCCYVRDKGYTEYYAVRDVAEDLGSAKVIGTADRTGPIILVPENLLINASASPESIPQMIVLPRDVDTNFVRSIATGLSDNYGLFCCGAIGGTDSSKTYWMHDVFHSLLVYKASGGWEYMNHDLFLLPTDFAPTLLSPDTATHALENLFVDAGWFPNDAVEEIPSGFYKSMVSCTGEELAESSWYMNVMPYFGRRTGGYKIIGPGAVIDASYGHYGVIEYICHGGWRDLMQGSNVEVITLEEALEGFALHGGDVPIGGFAPLCDTFIAQEAEIGYWEWYADSSIDELDMVWIIDGLVVYNDDTSDYELPIPARAPIRGDANGDQETNIVDIVYEINYLFKDGPAPFPVLRAGEVNCDGDVGLVDAVYLINYLFKAGPSPGDPDDDGIPDC